MQVAKERIKTLDRLRGLSIVYMLLGHMLFWAFLQEVWWFYCTFAVHDFLGGPMFVFVSGAGMTLSIRRHPETPAWVHHLRSLLILGLGFLTNVGSMNRVTLWGWSILVALCVFRVVGYYALKLRPWVRVLLIAIILVAARPLLLFLVGDIFGASYTNLYPGHPDTTEILAYILYSMPNQNTFLPYFGFFLAGTLFVDLLIGQPKEKQGVWRRNFFILGLVLVIVGILVGIFIWTDIDLGDSIRGYLSISGRILPAIPSLAFRNSLAWSLMMLGTQFLLALLFLKLEQQVYRNRFLTIYGEFSLTIFAANAPIFLVPPSSLPLLVVFPLIISTMLLTWYLCTLWYKKNKGKYSVEWFLNKAVKILSRHLENHLKSRDVKSGLQPKSRAEVPVGNTIELPHTEKPLPDGSKDP